MNIIGLTELKNNLSNMCDKGMAYRKGGAKVPHLVLNLSPDNGQTIAAEEITAVLQDNSLRKFCGLDPLLEYRLDGSYKQIQQIFEDIKSRAVYTNSYYGVVAIDISALSEHLNESQTDYFIEKIREVAETATVIIYYNDSLGKRVMFLKERVVEAIGKCIDIHLSPYSIEELAGIVVENLKERGIEVDKGNEMKLLLCKILDSEQVITAKQAVSTAESLVFIADYSDFVPRLDSKMLKNHIQKRNRA